MQRLNIQHHMQKQYLHENLLLISEFVNIISDFNRKIVNKKLIPKLFLIVQSELKKSLLKVGNC